MLWTEVLLIFFTVQPKCYGSNSKEYTVKIHTLAIILPISVIFNKKHVRSLSVKNCSDFEKQHQLTPLLDFHNKIKPHHSYLPQLEYPSRRQRLFRETSAHAKMRPCLSAFARSPSPRCRPDKKKRQRLRPTER